MFSDKMATVHTSTSRMHCVANLTNQLIRSETACWPDSNRSPNIACKNVFITKILQLKVSRCIPCGNELPRYEGVKAKQCCSHVRRFFISFQGGEYKVASSS